jgi:hypothetical protein
LRRGHPLSPASLRDCHENTMNPQITHEPAKPNARTSALVGQAFAGSFRGEN